MTKSLTNLKTKTNTKYKDSTMVPMFLSIVYKITMMRRAGSGKENRVQRAFLFPRSQTSGSQQRGDFVCLFTCCF